MMHVYIWFLLFIFVDHDVAVFGCASIYFPSMACYIFLLHPGIVFWITFLWHDSNSGVEPGDLQARWPILSLGCSAVFALELDIIPMPDVFPKVIAGSAMV
jgi:hypothetical protein